MNAFTIYIMLYQNMQVSFDFISHFTRLFRYKNFYQIMHSGIRFGKFLQHDNQKEMSIFCSWDLSRLY